MPKQKPRAHIKESAGALKEVFQRELAPMADVMIAQIMSRAKRKKDLTAIKEIHWRGEQAYQKKILEALAMIAADAIKAARLEVPKAKSIKLTEIVDSIKFDDASVTIVFEQLPKELRDRIAKEAQLLVGTQLSDLEKTIFYQYTDSFDTTDDLGVLKNDLNGAAMEFIDGQPIDAGANLLAAKVVNEARSAFFFDSDVLEEIEGFYFMNGDPVTPVCQDLEEKFGPDSGNFIAKDDPNLFRFTPPLHWNCKSYLDVVLTGDLPDGTKQKLLRPSTSELEDSIQFSEPHGLYHRLAEPGCPRCNC